MLTAKAESMRMIAKLHSSCKSNAYQKPIRKPIISYNTIYIIIHLQSKMQNFGENHQGTGHICLCSELLKEGRPLCWFHGCIVLLFPQGCGETRCHTFMRSGEEEGRIGQWLRWFLEFVPLLHEIQMQSRQNFGRWHIGQG